MYRFCPRNSPGSSVRSTRVPRIEPAGRSLTCVTPSPCHGSPPEPRVVAARPSLSLGVVLRLVLPKGSLEKATLELFEAADLHGRARLVGRLQGHDRRSAHRRGAHPAPAGDPDVRRRGPVRHRHHRSRLGRGDRRATSSASASCATPRPPADPIRVVVAVAGDSPVTDVADLPDGVRVSTEYPELTRRYFAAQGIDADVRLSATARARPRSPTSPTASSTSPRPAGPCAPPGCGSSTRSSSATPR